MDPEQPIHLHGLQTDRNDAKRKGETYEGLFDKPTADRIFAAMSTRKVTVLLAIGLIVCLVCLVNVLIPKKPLRAQRVQGVNSMRTLTITLTNQAVEINSQQPNAK
jgi:hypothetical protein